MRYFLLTTGLTLAVIGSARGATYVVRPDGIGDFPTIQAAINASVNGDTVLLANGVFTGDGNRDIHFLGKAITVGSLAGHPDSCIIDCQGSETDPHRGFDFDSGEEEFSVVQKVTITNGYVASGVSSQPNGGAVLCVGSSPTLVECVLVRNTALNTGGAIACLDGSFPTISNCSLIQNEAANDGGGIYVAGHAPGTIVIEDCEIRENVAEQLGGGMSCQYVTAAVAACRIEANISLSRGGGVHFYECEGTLSGCTLAGNYVLGRGGGAYFYGGAYSVTGCTFFGNLAAGAGGGFMVHDLTVVDIQNTIVSFSLDGGSIHLEGLYACVLFECCDIYGNSRALPRGSQRLFRNGCPQADAVDRARAIMTMS